MVEVNTNELFNAITSLKDEVIELKLSTQKDNADTRLQIAVSKNTQEQMHSDLIQLKSDVSKMREDINNMKQESAENKGEKKKSESLIDKRFFPIVLIIITVVINLIVTKLITPPQIQYIHVPNQIQQITPTPTIR